jgi:male-specific lethal 2
MRLDLRNVDSWKELSVCLPAVRHALMCCVCGRLLNSPMGLEPSACHHYVCQACLGGKMRYMKGGCGWCKEIDHFVPNAHLSSVVRCFRQLCVYLNGFITTSVKTCSDIDALTAIIREAVGDEEVKDSAPPVVSNAQEAAVESSETVSIEIPTTTENIATSSKPVKESHSPRKRRHQETADEPVRKRSKSFKRVRGESALKSKINDSVSASNISQSESVVGFENNDVETALLNWSTDNMHPSAHTGVHRNIDDESAFLSTGYDPHILLLENSVLAEHDYNKFSTVCDTAVSSTAIEPVSIAHSAKSLKRPVNTMRRSYSKKSAADRAAPIKKSSLTIRQMAERDQLANPVTVSKVAAITSNSETMIGKPTVQRRSKSGTVKIKVGCRCAMATPAPGKLTCCGQRCPCYAAFHGCSTSCKCRGCRNPRGDLVPTLPPINSAVPLKASTAGDLQPSLPLLFNAGNSVFNTASCDQQQSQLVLHAAKSRFIAEPFSCYGSG